MNTLVTGGNGFLGSYLVKELIKEGNNVSILDLTDKNMYLNVGEKNKVVQHRGNLSSLSHVMDAVKKSKPQKIFHLGTMLSIPSNEDPQTAFSVNAEGTLNVLEAARMFDVKQVLYASSIAVYGKDITGDEVNDHTLQRPTTAYGVFKVFSELIGQFYADKYGIDFRALRFSSIIGPGSKIKHVSVYNSWAIEKSGFGEPYALFVEPQIKCPVIYFRDAIASLISLSKVPVESIKTRCYNATGMEVKAEDIVKAIKRKRPEAVLKYEPETFAMDFFRPFQTKKYVDEKAIEEWNFTIQYDLDRMIDDFWTLLVENSQKMD